MARAEICTVSVCVLIALSTLACAAAQPTTAPFNETLLGTVSTFINVSDVPSKHPLSPICHGHALPIL